ncbi:MAG: hypothetical protein AAFP69_12635, partial [Planctomycetota bacterium]
RKVAADVAANVGVSSILEGELLGSDGQSSEASAIGELIDNVKALIKGGEPPSAEELAIDQLLQDVIIEAEPKSNLIQVSYLAEDYKLAAAVVDAWMQAFKREYVEMHHTDGTYQFYLDRDDELRAELDDIETRMRDRKSQFGLVTVAGQQQSLEQQILDVRKERSSTRTDLVASQTRMQTLNRTLKSLSPDTVLNSIEGLEDSASEGIITRIFELELLEKELDARYNNDHPRLIAVREQLADLRNAKRSASQSKRRTVTKGINPAHQQVKSQLIVEAANSESLADRAKELEYRFVRLNTELQQLNQQEIVIAKLQREYDALQQTYRVHAQAMEQARQLNKMRIEQITSIEIQQPASLQKKPVSPKLGACLMIGLAGAFCGGIGIALYRDGLLTQLTNIEDETNSALLDRRSDGGRQLRVDRHSAARTGLAGQRVYDDSPTLVIHGDGSRRSGRRATDVGFDHAETAHRDTRQDAQVFNQTEDGGASCEGFHGVNDLDSEPVPSRPRGHAPRREPPSAAAIERQLQQRIVGSETQPDADVEDTLPDVAATSDPGPNSGVGADPTHQSGRPRRSPPRYSVETVDSVESLQELLRYRIDRKRSSVPPPKGGNSKGGNSSGGNTNDGTANGGDPQLPR